MSPRARPTPERPAGRRSPRSRRRYDPRRVGRPRICILCEGRVTEPRYFEAVKRELVLSSVTIHHVPFEDMKNRIETLVGEDPGVDEIWCVVDEDERPAIAALLTWLTLRSAKVSKAPEIKSAVSIPCFEYWLLLHFEHTTRAFRASRGGDSACKQVIRELKKHIPGYDKAKPRTWQRCHERREEARRNAKQIATGGNVSSTEVWRLVDRLNQVSGLD